MSYHQPTNRLIIPLSQSCMEYNPQQIEQVAGGGGGGVPPYPETQNYLILVMRQLDKAAGARKAAAAAVKPAVVQRDPSAPAHMQEVVEADGSVRYVSR